MIVKCVGNNISFIKNDDVRKRIREWLDTEGGYNDIEVGNEYQVQAVAYFDGGTFYYLHSVDLSEHPYPYVAEFFEIVDSSLPATWEVGFQVESGKKRFKRLTFSEWATDDTFFEKLLDGDTQCISIYAENRINN